MSKFLSKVELSQLTGSVLPTLPETPSERPRRARTWCSTLSPRRSPRQGGQIPPLQLSVLYGEGHFHCIQFRRFHHHNLDDHYSVDTTLIQVESVTAVLVDQSHQWKLFLATSKACSAQKYRDGLKSCSQVWIILFLLLLNTSASTCLQHSHNLGTAF